MAVNLPADERMRLHQALAPLRETALPVRWLPAESLHLTLKFLDRIDEAQAETVKRTLGSVARAHASFDLELAGVGAFPSMARPQIWWVGVVPEPRLLALHSDLDAALESAGFPREQRPFAPHLTVGRTKGRSRRTGWADDLAGSFNHRTRFRVETVDLMETHLGSSGAKYERLMAAMLEAAAAAEGKGDR